MRAQTDGHEILNAQEKRRNRLLRGLDIQNSVGVEIGPLCSPLVQRCAGAQVIYVDHTDTAHLRQNYKNDPHVDIDAIVEIDGLWGENTLHEAIRGRYVDYVVASHVIEHVPDLVTWLRELGAVLKPTGEVRLAVPDRRFTFDYFRRESDLPEVLTSYIERTRVPHPFSLLDYCLNAVDVDVREAWQKKRIDASSGRRHHTWEGALHLARDAFENGTYHDVHCWVFTPRSFARLMRALCRMSLLDFACESFCDTARNEIEFSVILRRSHDQDYIDASWSRMELAASDATPGAPFWRVHRKLKELGAGQTDAWPLTRITGQSSDLDAVEPVVFPPDFVAADYLAANPDVLQAGADPIIHYKHFGWREGRPVRPPSAAPIAHRPVEVETK
jgi:SAM-dependent methyltransferase